MGPLQSSRHDRSLQVFFVITESKAQGEVLGLVVGAFGEVSQDAHHLQDEVAEKPVASRDPHLLLQESNESREELCSQPTDT